MILLGNPGLGCGVFVVPVAQLVEEAKLLEGPYKRAFEKVGSVMEDSGWLLAPPESEAGNVEMVSNAWYTQYCVPSVLLCSSVAVYVLFYVQICFVQSVCSVCSIP